MIVVPLNTSSNTYYSAMQVVRGSYHNKNPGGTKTGKQVSWDIVNLFESEFTKPSPGECYTWGGTHVKNFDGGMYRLGIEFFLKMINYLRVVFPVLIVSVLLSWLKTK